MRSELDQPTGDAKRACDAMRRIGIILNQWEAGLMSDMEARHCIKLIVEATQICAEPKFFTE
jgi:hypothetical protein